MQQEEESINDKQENNPKKPCSPEDAHSPEQCYCRQAIEQEGNKNNG